MEINIKNKFFLNYIILTFLTLFLVNAKLITNVFATNYAVDLPICQTGQTPALNNCSPLCSSLSEPIPRENCMNIVNLPLCSEITGTRTNKVNCINECTKGGNNLYLNNETNRHGIDCIKFCDIVENPQPGTNCIQRYCHQTSQTPSTNSCQKLTCNLLSKDELKNLNNRPSFINDQINTYCDSNTKCHNFNYEKLEFANLKLCNIHECKPEVSSCGIGESIMVTSQGSQYTNRYKDKILNCTNRDCTDIDLNSIPNCTKSTSCKPPSKQYLECNGNNRHSKCDQALDCSLPNNRERIECYYYKQERCDNPEEANTERCTSIKIALGSKCQLNVIETKIDAIVTTINSTKVANACYESIDCNLTINKSLSNCNPPTRKVFNIEDDTESWFYRPAPHPKAQNNSSPNKLKEMEYHPGRTVNDGRICYSTYQMDTINGWGDTLDLSWLGLGYHYFHDYLSYDTRSPGVCNPNTDDGSRGLGWTYLCGTNSNLEHRPSEEAGYIQGYPTTVFTNTTVENEIKVCLRFNNHMIPGRSCGYRECGITCVGKAGCSNVCGGDKCLNLVVRDGESCIFSGRDEDMSGRDCAGTIDGTLRVRAVRYFNRICAFIDGKGGTAYQSNFMNGQEKLDDGTCISGVRNKDGFCDGSFDSNAEKGLAHVWRASRMIKYQGDVTGNPKPIKENYSDTELANFNIYDGTRRGYFNLAGKFFPEMECVRTKLRKSTPRLYNLQNRFLNEKLFGPIPVIRNALTKYDTDNIEVSNPVPGEKFGKTDFHQPGVMIQYGDRFFNIGLLPGKCNGINPNEKDCNGDVTTTSTTTSQASSNVLINAPEKGYAIMSTQINKIPYSIHIFAKKEFKKVNDIVYPLFCIYQNIIDPITGEEKATKKIECINRNFPNIHFENTNNRGLESKLTITSSFDDASVNLRYIVSTGANNIFNNCQNDDICTNSVTLEDNSEGDMDVCNENVEGYRLCIKRDRCSKILKKCLNYINEYYEALGQNNSVTAFESEKRNCEESLIPSCASKFGYVNPTNISDFLTFLLNPNSRNTTLYNQNLYGFFNEICITEGFNDKLKNVLITDNIEQTKCIVDQASSPYLRDSSISTNCNEGGKAPNCLCTVAVDDNSSKRKETHREAGLCIDLPRLNICQPISYGSLENDESLNRNVTNYNDSNGIHTSHQRRTANSAAGHAEFPHAKAVATNIAGTCSGFWKYQTTSEGNRIFPKYTCSTVDNVPTWINLRDQCLRYSCNSINIDESDEKGEYSYPSGLTAEINGYATWPNYTKTNDFFELVTANGCIAGYKATNANPIVQNGIITGYTCTNCNYPKRYCNQIGMWKSVLETPNTETRYCQAITCPAISHDRDAIFAGNQALLERASRYGGADFSSTTASKSKINYTPNSIVTGTCRNDLGFYQVPNAPPKLKCDYLGNWSAVENACVTSCKAITDEAKAASDSNGFAKWQEVTSTSASGTAGEFDGCVTGYITNPYPPTVDERGNPLPESEANNLTRPARNPFRFCGTQNVSGTNSSVSAWGKTYNGCVNKCPGGDIDARIGVGKTSHPGFTAPLSWPTTTFGQTVTLGFPSNTASQYGSDYQENRNNSNFIIKRTCGANGKWQEPKIYCAVNGGRIENAILPPQLDLEVGGSVNAEACASGYYPSKDLNNQNTNIKYTCTYPAGFENYPQKVYLKRTATNGQQCRFYCRSTEFQTVPNTNNSSQFRENILLSPGESTYLLCNAGFANKIINNINTMTEAEYLTMTCMKDRIPGIIFNVHGSHNVTYVNGEKRYLSNRSKYFPQATCNENGSYTITNACDRCADCIFNGGALANTTGVSDPARNHPNMNVYRQDRSQNTFEWRDTCFQDGATYCLNDNYLDAGGDAFWEGGVPGVNALSGKFRSITEYKFLGNTQCIDGELWLKVNWR